MKKPARTLADLRPGLVIKCFSCGDTKPETGSQKFHGHKVCADCVTRLQTMDRKVTERE